MPISVGEKAPSFSLADTDRTMRSLKDFLATKTVLAFIPGAFTSVCTAELCSFQDSIADLQTLGSSVVAIDVDSPFVNKAFAEANKLEFPLLSDYTREVSTRYCGVHKDFAGLPGYSVPKRAVFLISRDGVVKYSWISENPGAEPPYEEIKKALATFE